MKNSDLLQNFTEINIKSPVDIIIGQIKELISSGEIQPGTKLPPERKLAEQFGIGRSYVREAIRRLEFYGIVRVLPQSGTIVAGLGIAAIEGLISNVLQLTEDDFSSLVETRYILEISAAKMAATRRTDQDIEELTEALKNYEREVKNENQGIDQDLMFHLKIAEVSKNQVLKSLMMLITPDILNNYLKKDVCGDGKFHEALSEHKEILDAIIAKDPDKAEKCMQNHLSRILERDY